MDKRIAELDSRMAAIERRLRALEGAEQIATTDDRKAAEPSLDSGFVGNASSHIGRVLLIFGGAYLLRAITDFQFVPVAIGILMGASYAVFWLILAWRKGRIDAQRAKAAFYGCTSVLLLLPLLVEAINRFDLLSGAQGVFALTVYCALALAVAGTQDLRSIGWLVIAGGIGTAVAVLVVAQEAVLVAAFLLLLGLASLWVVYWRRWMGPQWLGAIGANVGVGALVVFSRSEQWAMAPEVPVIFAAVALLLYLVSFAIHSHMHGRDVGMFETLQALVLIGIAFGAASLAASSGQVSLGRLGVFATVLGIAAYAFALSRETRAVRRQNFYYYSTLGLLLVVGGSALVVSPLIAAVFWSLLAMVMAWGSGRTGWVSLSLQSTVLLLAAGVGSGILATGAHALAGDASAWPALHISHVGIALTTVICLFMPVAQQSERWGAMAGLPQLLVLALSVWEVGGLMVVFLGPLLADAGQTEPNLAVLAALRTAILSTSSVTLALSSRHKRWPEARWLVYPVLVLVGLKLFAEDFPNGQPATLFVALAFVGGALLLVARLLNRGETATQ